MKRLYDLSGFLFSIVYYKRSHMSEEIIQKTVLTGRIEPLYIKYLTAAFGIALISSIYGMVDMAIVLSIRGRTARQL